MLFALAVASLVPAVLGYLLGLRDAELHPASAPVVPLVCAAVSGGASFVLGLVAYILRYELPHLLLIWRTTRPAGKPSKDKS